MQYGDLVGNSTAHNWASHNDHGSQYPPFVQEFDSDLLQVFMGAKNNGHALGNVVWSHKH